MKMREYTSHANSTSGNARLLAASDFSYAQFRYLDTMFAANSDSTMTFDTVVVHVGKPSVDILVYKDLICSVSSYFRGSINHSFLGVKDGTITLRDVSEATFRTFLAWCYSQCLPISPNDDLLVSSDHRKNSDKVDTNILIGRGRPHKRLFDEYVVGRSPYFHKMAPKEVDNLYHKNPAWQAKYQEVVKSLIRLYIFANKYSIHQLQDDVMSTYIGYCISYGFYPDPDDVEIVELVYKNLPSTSMLARYLVLSTIYFWSPAELTLESGKLDRLHPKFTRDVMTAQAQRTQPPNDGETKVTKAVPHLAKYGLKNSCVFHEHLHINSTYCRHRLANSKFIFDALLNACVKEAENILRPP